MTERKPYVTYSPFGKFTGWQWIQSRLFAIFVVIVLAFQYQPPPSGSVTDWNSVFVTCFLLLAYLLVCADINFIRGKNSDSPDSSKYIKGYIFRLVFWSCLFIVRAVIKDYVFGTEPAESDLLLEMDERGYTYVDRRIIWYNLINLLCFVAIVVYVLIPPICTKARKPQT